MIWFTSDLHLNHMNILKYEPISRPFDTVEEMNETLIGNWNACVKDDDTVFILGDLCMAIMIPRHAARFLKRNAALKFTIFITYLIKDVILCYVIFLSLMKNSWKWCGETIAK